MRRHICIAANLLNLMLITFWTLNSGSSLVIAIVVKDNNEKNTILKHNVLQKLAMLPKSVCVCVNK